MTDPPRIRGDDDIERCNGCVGGGVIQSVGKAEDSDDEQPGDERTVGPRLVSALKIARELLPGDSRYGDPLSTVGSEPRQIMARRLGELASERPGLLKEAGLSALQVWEAVAGGGEGKPRDERLA